MRYAQQRTMLQIQIFLHLLDNSIQNPSALLLISLKLYDFEKPVFLATCIPLPPLPLLSSVTQPQCIVMIDQLLPRCLQPFTIQLFACLQQNCLVIVMGFLKLLVKEPALDWGQRHFSFDCALLTGLYVTILHALGKSDQRGDSASLQ